MNVVCGPKLDSAFYTALHVSCKCPDGCELGAWICFCGPCRIWHKTHEIKERFLLSFKLAKKTLLCVVSGYANTAKILNIALEKCTSVKQACLQLNILCISTHETHNPSLRPPWVECPC